jgi:hypothetical protein
MRRSGGRADAQPFVELRPASSARNIANGDRYGLLLADENHEPLAACDAGVEQISLQHRVVLGHDRYDHSGIFGTLTLVDDGGIGGNQPRNVHAVSPTLSAITAPSDRSSSRAVTINSFGASSNLRRAGSIDPSAIRSDPRPSPRSARRIFPRATGSWPARHSAGAARAV